jgi:hypothetical protein
MKSVWAKEIVFCDPFWWIQFTPDGRSSDDNNENGGQHCLKNISEQTNDIIHP